MKMVEIGPENDMKSYPDLEEKRKGKKTVAFLGLAPRTRQYAPFDDLSIEIWTLGRAWRDRKIEKGNLTEETWIKRISRHFEIHPESFCYLDTKPDELHTKWLRENHPFPIYMDDKYPEFPSSVRYPIEYAVNTYGRHFTSTMSYMFPIADKDGFDRVELYGFEMGHGGEYAYQMPEVSYHIGWFRAKHGYDSVYIPKESKILRAPLYAYEEMYNPILTTIEQRISMMQKTRIAEEKTGAKFEGAVVALKELAKELDGIEYNKTFKELLDRMEDEYNKQTILVNNVGGALHDNLVLRDAIYYMMPPSYKTKPTVDLSEATVPWDGIELPWEEDENVKKETE